MRKTIEFDLWERKSRQTKTWFRSPLHACPYLGLTVFEASELKTTQRLEVEFFSAALKDCSSCWPASAPPAALPAAFTAARPVLGPRVPWSLQCPWKRFRTHLRGGKSKQRVEVVGTHVVLGFLD